MTGDEFRARYKLRKRLAEGAVRSYEAHDSRGRDVFVHVLAGRALRLRRAVGALRGDIRNQFLIEAALLAGSGGVVGIAVGIGFTYAISSLGYWQTIISWPAVGASFAFSVAVGIIFGIYPAIRAATLEPIEALRAD